MGQIISKSCSGEVGPVVLISFGHFGLCVVCGVWCEGISELPARLIYEEVLPEVVSRLMSPETEVPYWRGSPYGGENWDTADPTVGDIVSATLCRLVCHFMAFFVASMEHLGRSRTTVSGL